MGQQLHAGYHKERWKSNPVERAQDHQEPEDDGRRDGGSFLIILSASATINAHPRIRTPSRWILPITTKLHKTNNVSIELENVCV